MAEIKERGKPKGQRSGRSEFGKCLYDLMLSRDIVTATELAQEMQKQGKAATDKRVRQYWSGTSKPSRSFMRDVGEVLALTRGEKARLSMSAFFGEEWREL
jgi:hypothetical protein